jgi:hypothetical protein
MFAHIFALKKCCVSANSENALTVQNFVLPQTVVLPKARDHIILAAGLSETGYLKTCRTA